MGAARASAKLLLNVCLLSMMAHGTSSTGYCGDGVCSGAETGAWCNTDCFCGDGLCNMREQVDQLCPSECFSQFTVVGQPRAATEAGLPLTAETQVCHA